MGRMMAPESRHHSKVSQSSVLGPVLGNGVLVPPVPKEATISGCRGPHDGDTESSEVLTRESRVAFDE